MSQQSPHIPPYYTPATPAALPPRRRSFGSLFGWVLFLGLAFVVFALLSRRGDGNTPGVTPIPLSEFAERLKANEVRSIVLSADEIRGELNAPPSTPTTRRAASGPDGARFTTALPGGMGGSWGFVEWLLEHRGDAVVTAAGSQDDNAVYNIFLPLIPWLMIFGFVWLFVIRPLRTHRAQSPVVFSAPGRWVPDPPPQSSPSPPQ